METCGLGRSDRSLIPSKTLTRVTRLCIEGRCCFPHDKNFSSYWVTKYNSHSIRLYNLNSLRSFCGNIQGLSLHIYLKTLREAPTHLLLMCFNGIKRSKQRSFVFWTFLFKRELCDTIFTVQPNLEMFVSLRGLEIAQWECHQCRKRCCIGLLTYKWVRKERS